MSPFNHIIGVVCVLQTFTQDARAFNALVRCGTGSNDTANPLVGTVTDPMRPSGAAAAACNHTLLYIPNGLAVFNRSATNGTGGDETDSSGDYSYNGAYDYDNNDHMDYPDYSDYNGQTDYTAVDDENNYDGYDFTPQDSTQHTIMHSFSTVRVYLETVQRALAIKRKAPWTEGESWYTVVVICRVVVGRALGGWLEWRRFAAPNHY